MDEWRFNLGQINFVMISLIFENFVRIFFGDVELHDFGTYGFRKKFGRFISWRCLATIKILRVTVKVIHLAYDKRAKNFEV